ncbi:hypothetical protein ACNKHP_08940 [Shigella boydii]
MLKLDAITLKNLDAKGNQPPRKRKAMSLPVTIFIAGRSVDYKL